MIFTFTDFGTDGPYMGQMRAAILTDAPGMDVVDLMVDVPAFNPCAAAYLLAAAIEPLPSEFVCVAVVDPGVGSSRRPIIMRCGDRWFVGPDNGLFEIVARRSDKPLALWEITWRPSRMSKSFHGRDLFAPVAARLARDGERALDHLACPINRDIDAYKQWPDDLDEVIYIDGYGNCMLGCRCPGNARQFQVVIDSVQVDVATTFSDVPVGQTICYENSIGLVEIAVNQGNAADRLGLEIGTQVAVRKLSGK